VTDATLPDTWRGPLAEMGIEPRSAEAPDDATGEWLDVYSQFATRGFLRVLFGPREETNALRVQLALPTGSFTGRRVLEAVSTEFEETLGGSWRTEQVDPDWELVGDFDSPPTEAAVATFFGRLDDLAAVTDADTLEGAPWLIERLERPSEPSETNQDVATDDASSGTATDAESGAGADVFESIGDADPEASGPTPMLEDAGLAAYEIARSGDGLDIHLGLDVALPVTDLEELGTALAHALRARYDLDVRPRPVEDDHPSLGESSIAVRAEPTDLGVADVSDPAEMRSRVDEYFSRLERFDNLGVKLADVLGLTGETERSFDRTTTSPTDRESGGRTSETGASTPPRDRRDAEDQRESDDRPDRSQSAGTSPDRPSGSDRRASRPEPDDNGGDSGVVLDIGGESASESPTPSGELEAGNYRDPRLLREDATTSLVDVVLRHPGYAEEKMAHNLSILLSIDYPDATDLVESAPCVIAWGVGRERGLKFKRVVENAGGRIVLIEPDSLSR